ncbi:MAPEG family protein [Luteimonas sp. RIT-PG2_3]
MTPRITLLFTSLHALMFVVLTMRVVMQRRSNRIGIGDGGHSTLARSVRVHGNFSEYVPLALILMALLELSGVPAAWLWVLGAMLLLGRILHAVGLGGSIGVSPGRLVGMLLTLISLLLMAALGIYRAVLPTLLA